MMIHLIKIGLNLRSPATKTQTVRRITIGKFKIDTHGISYRTHKKMHSTLIQALKKLEASNRKEKQVVFQTLKISSFRVVL